VAEVTRPIPQPDPLADDVAAASDARCADMIALLTAQAEGNRQHYHVMYVVSEMLKGHAATERLLNAGIAVLRQPGHETRTAVELDAELRAKIGVILAGLEK
jgi:hypothetical protein